MTPMAEPDMSTDRRQLADLVNERKAVLKIGYERLAERCIDPETGKRSVTSSWLYKLATGGSVLPPDLDVLRGLAAGLQVPLGRVQDAAGAQFFGIQTVWSKSGRARALMENAERLTARQLEQIESLIDTFTDDTDK